MAKVDLGADFAALSTDEFANALALIVAALRGVVVPRNALTGAIEITEGPDAVQPTATLGATDAFWHTLYTRFINIDGTLVSARTLLPVIPLFFTRPADATEDQSAVTTWAWPYDLESAARITLVSPQVGGGGGVGGAALGASAPNQDRYLVGEFSGPTNRNIVGGYYSLTTLVSSLSRGDEFRFTFGRGGVGGAGGAPAAGTPSGSELIDGGIGGMGTAPVGATAMLAPGPSSPWLALPSVPTGADDPLFNHTAVYIPPLNVSAGNTLTPRTSRNSFFQFFYTGAGDAGATGISAIVGQGSPTPGLAGQGGSPGLIIIEPIRGST